MSEKVITYSNLAEFKNKADEKYQDRLTAGTGITIDENNVISAQGGGGGASYEGVSPIVVDNDAGTIGAETVPMQLQQITHDDTLVHMSSDSNYALGVNLDVVKRLMGVDETVLWEDEWSTSNRMTSQLPLQFSEPLSNFEEVKFIVVGDHPHTNSLVFPTSLFTNGYTVILGSIGHQETSGSGLFYRGADVNVTLSGITSAHYYTCSINPTVSQNNSCYVSLYKVIGIGRKGGN